MTSEFLIRFAIEAAAGCVAVGFIWSKIVHVERELVYLRERLDRYLDGAE